jgi:anaerobic ribonucleoside-triphosphate reductase activating protein
MLQVAQFVPATDAEGPGRRAAIWLQGCPLRCPGCCNPEFLPFDGGTDQSVEEIVALISAAKTEHQIEGVSLLGGEPFAQATAAAELAIGVQRLGLSVMIYSGYTLAELQTLADADQYVQLLLAATDLLVDGRYEKENPEPSRRWIGSANQQIHFLTDKYRADDPRWRQPNTLEIRLVDGELAVNGFPGVNAKALWKRPKTTGSSKGKSQV